MPPATMRAKRQWLVWRLEKDAERPERTKLLKVPYYVDGGKRVGDQGDERDRRRLAVYAAALKAHPPEGREVGCGGLGFAFLPGDGLFGVDLDNVIDEDGVIDRNAVEIVKRCESFTELSPSGRGLHIYLAHPADVAPEINKSGDVDIYCGAQYFTVTGNHYAGTPLEVREISHAALAWLNGLINQIKDKKKRARAKPSVVAGAREHKQEPAAETATGARDKSGGDDFARVNDAAMQSLHAWVPALLPAARTYLDGYRVSSKDLGRELEEDLSILPKGIVDWGVNDMGDAREGRRTPIDLVLEWHASAKKPAEALHWLADRLGIALTDPERKTKPRRSSTQGDRGKTPAARGAAGPINWDDFFRRFTLIYPTETAWDAELGEIVKVSAMKIAFGKGPVTHWLDSPNRRTVNAENVVFDPAQKCDPATTVNLFRGLPFKPSTAGSCRKLLELLQYLCGEADQDQAPITDFVLRWIARPLRHLGAKMQTAVVMYGPEGTGKNLFWGAVNQIYGEYGTVITQFQLQSQFNDWASRKMFVVANEVITRMELKHLVGYLKTLVTEPRIPIETKNMPVRTEDNRMQLVFLSNELRPLHIAPGDRRYMVIRTPHERDAAYYAGVAAEIAAGGSARLYHYLLNEIDMGDFGEHTKPIATQAKTDLIELGLSSTQLFWQELHGGLLPFPYGPCLSTDLFDTYLAWCGRNGEKTPARINAFSHEFMSMNGVSRRVLRVADPERPFELELPADQRRQRKVFVMGARPEAIEEPRWIQTSLASFRHCLKDFRNGTRPLGAQRASDEVPDEEQRG